MTAKGADAAGLRGALHWIQPHRVRGWAQAPARPEEAVRIDVWLDAKLVGCGVAVPEPGRINPRAPGQPGFVVESVAGLPAGGGGRVVVTATGSDGTRRVLELPQRPARPA